MDSSVYGATSNVHLFHIFSGKSQEPTARESKQQKSKKQNKRNTKYIQIHHNEDNKSEQESIIWGFYVICCNNYRCLRISHRHRVRPKWLRTLMVCSMWFDPLALVPHSQHHAEIRTSLVPSIHELDFHTFDWFHLKTLNFLYTHKTKQKRMATIVSKERSGRWRKRFYFYTTGYAMADGTNTPPATITIVETVIDNWQTFLVPHGQNVSNNRYVAWWSVHFPW